VNSKQDDQIIGKCVFEVTESEEGIEVAIYGNISLETMMKLKKLLPGIIDKSIVGSLTRGDFKVV